MPWQIDGTFLRVTNDTSETGEDSLWQQDLSASVKIIATRHDYHDHDLASGIARALNIDGYNQMYANLNAGGFKVVNLDDGTLVNDAAAFGQIAGSVEFNDVSRLFTLKDRNGSTIDTVTIPAGSGGGGSGTVMSIAASGGLTSTPNPITVSGTISMAVLGVGQTYSGGISTITLDDYGRVTQVTTGAFANTNLSDTQGLVNTTIHSSTGTGTVIAAATPSASGVMSAEQAQQLADLVAAGAGGMIPPTEIIGVNESVAAGYEAAVTAFTENSNSVINNVGWAEVFSYTGSGIVEYFGNFIASFATNAIVDARLLIDGVVVWSKDALYNQTTDTAGDGMSIIGFYDGATPTNLPELQPIKFNTSFVFEAKTNQANATVMDAQIKWQKQT